MNPKKVSTLKHKEEVFRLNLVMQAQKEIVVRNWLTCLNNNSYPREQSKRNRP